MYKTSNSCCFIVCVLLCCMTCVLLCYMICVLLWCVNCVLLCYVTCLCCFEWLVFCFFMLLIFSCVEWLVFSWVMLLVFSCDMWLVFFVVTMSYFVLVCFTLPIRVRMVSVTAGVHMSDPEGTWTRHQEGGLRVPEELLDGWGDSLGLWSAWPPRPQPQHMWVVNYEIRVIWSEIYREFQLSVIHIWYSTADNYGISLNILIITILYYWYLLMRIKFI